MTVTLHHVALASPKAAEAIDFYTTDWGLHEVGREDGNVRLAAGNDRGDDYSLVIVHSDSKRVDHFCLLAGDEDSFDELAGRLRQADVQVLTDAPTCPGLDRALHIVDLDGRHVELGYRAVAPSGKPAEKRDAVPLKPGHIVLNTPDIVAATRWYEQNLGFGVRDWRAKKMSFLWHNEDHHTVAFNAAPHASLNHIAYELPGINEFFRAVGRAGVSDRAEKIYGPGRHGPGDYVFCYFLDPMGFICEYETDGVRVPDPEDYEFRVWEYSPESADQWLGTLSGGITPRFRKASLGEPDPGTLVTN